MRSAYQTENFAADGNGTALTLPASYVNVTAYIGTNSTFGSGTLKLQVTHDGSTYIDVTSASFTSATASTKKNDYLVYGKKVRWVLSGSTSPNIDIQTVARPVFGKAVAARNLVSFTADGTSDTFNAPEGNALVGWSAFGTFGSGTVKLQASPDGGTSWYNVDTTTSAALKLITSNVDSMFRFVLSGSTNPTLKAVLFFVRG